MHAIHGLLWEQWRQSRYWVIGTTAFLILLTGGVWFNRPWIMDEFHNDPFVLDRFAWMVAFTALGLLFINYRIHDVSLQFPRRQFALPCRTLPLMACHLVYKSAIAVLLGGLISAYQWVLMEQAQPSALPIALFLALVAVAQALIMLGALFGPWTGMALGLASAPFTLLLYYALGDVAVLGEDRGAYVTAVVVALIGWAVSLACAPATRHGRRENPATTPRWAYDGTTLSVRIPRPVVLQWNFSSPVWAQCWYEWRRVLVWVPRVIAPALVLWGLGLAYGNYVSWGPWATLVPLGVGASVVFACSYFLLRVSQSEGRFLLAQPGGERALVDGKLLSCLVSALIASAIAVTLLIGIAFLAATFGASYLLGEAHIWIPMTAVGFFALVWVGLTSTPFYAAALVTGVTLGFGVMTPFTVVAGLGIHPYAAVAFTTLVVAALCVAAWRTLRARGIPLPWELSFVLLAFAPQLLSLILFFHLPYRWGDGLTGFLAPLGLVLGGLVFARRIDLISRRRSIVVFSVHLIVAAWFVALIWGSEPWGPFTDAYTVFWWIAACFAPIIWVPLAVRLQRYR